MRRKIVLIDVKMGGGHHIPYINAISECEDCEFLLILNERNEENQCRQIIIPWGKEKIGLIYFLKICRQILKISKREKIDAVHFLEGDWFLKYFGIGLLLLIIHKIRIFITYHHIFETRVRMLSYRVNAWLCNTLVVHTDYQKELLISKNIKNVLCINYPHFTYKRYEDEISEDFYIIRDRGTVSLLALGETRFNKGLDILLLALQKVNIDFNLCIAGREVDFRRDQIEALCRPYTNKVNLILRYLTNEEMEVLIKNVDVIVLPYRKAFSGASGPMTDGVYYEKMIVGPNEKSIGNIIKEYELGYTFRVEDIDDLAKTLIIAITSVANGRFSYSSKSFSYRDKIDVKHFIKDYSNLYFQ